MWTGAIWGPGEAVAADGSWSEGVGGARQQRQTSRCGADWAADWILSERRDCSFSPAGAAALISRLSDRADVRFDWARGGPVFVRIRGRRPVRMGRT